MDSEPGEAGVWDEVLKLNQRVADAGKLEQWFGPSVDQLFAKEGIRTDLPSRTRVVQATFTAIQQAANVNRRKALGDYAPDQQAARFPELERDKGLKTCAANELDLFALLDHKFKSLGKEKTRRDYTSNLKKFVALIGHQDARRVTKDEVRQWRDKLIEDGLSSATINGKALAALSSVLTHAVDEYSLTENVANGIRDKRETTPNGPKGYDEEQAKIILEATFRGTRKRLSAPNTRAVFWIPWILAYTGLRVSEVAQMLGTSVRHERDGTPFLFVTSDDGSTKGGKAWITGIHPHLIELGILETFAAFGDGPVFYTPYPEGTDLKAIAGQHRAKLAGNKVSEWIKDEIGIPPPLGRPNHAWRHRFTTLSRTHQMTKENRDYMLGSGAMDAREGYGDFEPIVVNREIAKLPRFDVTDTGWRPPNTRAEPTPVRGAPRLKQRRRKTPSRVSA